jgi:hypothetical protein
MMREFGVCRKRNGEKSTLPPKHLSGMFPNTDRRSFLCRTAAIAAGAAIVGPEAASITSEDVPELRPTLDNDAWNSRLLALHKQLYSSGEFGFDDIMTNVYHPPEGYVLADHSVVRRGDDWHLFYVTGQIKYADEWIAAIRDGNFQHAQEVPYEVGDGHAAGPALNRLEFKTLMLQKPQGDFGLGAQDSSKVFPFGDGYIDIYSSRGPAGQSLSLARSSDLYRWDLDPANPFWRAPAYAMPHGVCKSMSPVRHPTEPIYLLYYNLTLADGSTCVALLTTRDFKRFEDRGPVIKMPPQLRGTQGCESPCVIYREGIWHLFFGCGIAWWHAVSNRPDSFMGGQGFRSVSVGGCYMMGPYHAAVVFKYRDRYYFSTTRKEYQRRLNRDAGVLKFRGSAADESSLLAGLFLCAVDWKGDQPILRKLQESEIP